MSVHHHKPVAKPTLVAPAACSVCGAAYDRERWPRSRWTLTGFSPWCPPCHKLLAKREKKRGYTSQPI